MKVSSVTSLVTSLIVATLAAIGLSFFFNIALSFGKDVQQFGLVSAETKPCKFATPDLAKLAAGFGAFDYAAHGLFDREDAFQRSRSAFCNSESVDDFVRALYRTHELSTTTNDTKDFDYLVCKYGRKSRNGEDVQSRLARSFLASIPGLFALKTRLRDDFYCSVSESPLSAEVCPNMYPAMMKMLNDIVELSDACEPDEPSSSGDRRRKLDGSSLTRSAKLLLPECSHYNTTVQIAALFLSGMFSKWDAESNGGECFSNKRDRQNVEDMCDFSQTSEKNDELQEIRQVRKHEYIRCETSPNPTYEADDSQESLCKLSHTFGLYDIDSLFGLPDASMNADVKSTKSSWLSFAYKLYEFVYDKWFESQLTALQSKDGRLAVRVYATFRMGVSFFWLAPAISICVFWIAYGGTYASREIYKLVSMRIETQKWNLKSGSDVYRPMSSRIRLLAYFSTAFVAFWMTAIDPYPIPETIRLEDGCDDYSQTSVYASSATRKQDALAALFMVAAATVIALIAERVFAQKSDYNELYNQGENIGLFLIFVALTALGFEGANLSVSIKAWISASDLEPSKSIIEESTDNVVYDSILLVWTAIAYASASSLYSQRWVCFKAVQTFKFVWIATILTSLWTVRIIKVTYLSNKNVLEYNVGLRKFANYVLYGCEITSTILVLLSSLPILQYQSKTNEKDRPIITSEDKLANTPPTAEEDDQITTQPKPKLFSKIFGSNAKIVPSQANARYVNQLRGKIVNGEKLPLLP